MTRRQDRPVAGRILLGVVLLPLLGLVALVLSPVPQERLALARASSLRVAARDGTLLREFVARDGDGHAAPAHLKELPPHVWQAFVAAEDARYFHHPGLDPLALVRAAAVDLRRGRLAQGGSTIPQQLARLLEPRPRTLAGKLGEAWLALRLTRTLSKEALLESYLSRIPLGNDVRGVEAAARLYFDRPAASLSVAQAALLAVLPRSPGAFDPLRHPERSRGAVARLLARMAARGFLSPAQLASALSAPPDLASEKLARAFEAPHFVDRVARSAAPPAAVSVTTTLDLALQRKLEAAVREEVAALADKRATSAAVVILDNQTGEALAWVGSPDWFDEGASGRIDAVRTLRQPGSTLKPFAYGLALERRGLTAATLLGDVESHFSTPTGDYLPRNYDRRAHGPVRLRVALGSSYNVPAVKVAEKLGAGELLAVLHDAGFSSLREEADHYGLGLVLGNGEVMLEELARGYAGLARGGVALPALQLVREGRGADGALLPAASVSGATLRGQRFLRASTAALVADILSDPAARAPAFGLDNVLRLPFAVAAKTGTSRAYTDNWVAGFTHERTVAVWVGNMSGATMRGASGITGAGPLFHRAMTLAMAGVDRPAPLFDEALLEAHEVCALSGALPGPDCPATVAERFVPGSAPKLHCKMHGPDGLDLGPRFYDWAAHEGLATLNTARGGGPRAALLFPGEGDEYLRDRDLPDPFQTIPVRALAPEGGGLLELQLDDGPRQELAPPYSTRVPASPGRHELLLYRRGAAEPDARVRFVVRG